MAWFDYSTCILALCFCLNGKLNAQKVHLPAVGKVSYWMPGSTVALNWTYNLEAGKNLISRTWLFKSKPQDEPSILVTRFQTNAPQYKSNRTVEYIAPSMLLFQNASLADNGTYTFELGYYDGFNKKTQSVVEVIILVQPTANVSCPSNNKIKEGENFSCFCNGTTGNPPPLAKWSKNGVVINGNGFRTKELVFENVTKHMSGNYTCTVGSHNLTDFKVIELYVPFPPKITSFSSSEPNNVAPLGSTIKIICMAEGYPAVSYTITHNNRTVARYVNPGIFTIPNLTYNNSGTYVCFAKNSLGYDTDRFYLNVTAETPTPTQSVSVSTIKPDISYFRSDAPNNRAKVGDTVEISCSADGYPDVNVTIYRDCNVFTTAGAGRGVYTIKSVKSTDAGEYKCVAENSLGTVTKTFTLTVNGSSSSGIEWYIALIAFLVGILVGIASLFAVMRLRRRSRKGRTPTSQATASTGGRPEGSQNAVYQELDLKRMNEGDNYQSLRENFRHARSNQAVEENEGGYQELNKIRERGDENYQSLNRV